MNMFKKSRKAKDQDDTVGSDAAPMSKAARALTRKKKKHEAEEKPELELDLSSALPASNEFRTSLLMPNLSARFSMLREQDDPNTRVGKASDASVLFPKRASRLMLFNNNPLTDIAEVESVYSSFRPPFAEERHGSISDGYASDDGGSIMNRSRHGEGNNLFGGRQKLYKIPTSSSKNLPTEGAMTSAKHMYENDVSLSAFQQLRLREKEQREQHRDLDEKTDRSSFPTTEAEDQDSTRSPVNAFSRNRGTQSSTNSGPSNRRISTAATSVVSDSPLPQQNSHVITKIREQEVNSSAESISFATSPSLRKVREEGNNSPQRISQPRSAVNMRDNHPRDLPIPQPQTFRSMSPPSSAASQPLDFGIRENTKSPPTPRFQTTSPMSQFDFEQDDTLAGSLRPNDRGKATALGLFNKPARHYDDAQFQQRQVQMHEGRNSPLSASSRAASRASPEPTRSARPSYASTSSPRPSEDNVAPQIPPILDYPPSPASNGRPSVNSGSRRSTSRPRTKSSTSTKEATVQARVQSLIRKQNAELAALEATQLGLSQPEAESENVALPAKKHNYGTFFNNSDDSDSDEQEGERERQPSATSMTNIQAPAPPPSDIHPALRDAMQDFDFGTGTQRPSYPWTSNCSTPSKTQPLANDCRQSEQDAILEVKDVDSPTIPTTGLGLSGLIRTHLRTDSDKSSMFPPPSPALLGTDGLRGSISSTTQTATESVKSDPFEYDNDRLSVRQLAPVPEAPPTPTTLMSLKAQQILGTAMALRDAQNKADATPKVDTSDEVVHPNNHHETYPDPRRHQRNESTETQKEMQRFDEELAQRRKKIEESLNTVQERSRSKSPVAERLGSHAGHGLSLPRFPGRSNTGDRAEPHVQSKAMKMLGITPASRDQMSPRPLPEHFEGDRARDMSSRQAYRPPTAQDYGRPTVRHTPSSGRPGRPGPGHGYDRPPPPRSTTPSSRSGGRNRSNSAAVDRSVSRNQYVPDFDRSMMPGAFPNSPFPSASPQENSHLRSDSPANRTYERSGSSAAGHYADRAGYFANKPLAHPEMDNGFTPRLSPRPSPNPSDGSYQTQLPTPMSPPSSGMPSPNPAMQNGRTTPTSVPGRVTPSGHRKRSVTKGMISEPTFVSSTSTVPLVHLPRDGGPAVDPTMAPPVPPMNPRRRGNTADQASPGFAPHPAVRPAASPLPLMPESPNPDYNSSSQSLAQPQPPQHRPRNKLRKSSSEGGNMAARARQQALMVEMAKEKDRSPNAAAFPNKSATSLPIRDGVMF
ncbi:hypothetical protein LTR70_003393 [Exophiala xenobiotica]|uniref:Supervillin n=1 Tax=Lithohypha guttulata TaxID=1690604 RepID=A0ABR0KGD7_9EURO|nr:hypothetical protein LTR24_002941 [Lithohypha guttulata]KAK5323531.1 hypothetical protein LTR70_003393 [Exophiala xenobiotica]